MSTLSAKIFKHHKKADGTYNVKICIAQKQERVYMDTNHYVTDKQLTKDLKVKDLFVLSCINRTLDHYRRHVSDMEHRLDSFNAKALKEYFLKKDEKVDFLKFCEIYFEQLKEAGRNKSHTNYKTVRNSILDFIGNKECLPIEYITIDFISKYERFLRGNRPMKRIDRLGKEYTAIGKPLGDASVHIYLRDFQGLFSAAMAFYNKPSLGLNPITYNPFKEYKKVDAPETAKRSLRIEEIILIRDCHTKVGGRAELAKNLSMLSFYLCGMNAVDLYEKRYSICNGRLEYFRSKTKGKRKDRAFISIKIPNEALPLLDFAATIRDRYANIDNLNRAISQGMATLSSQTGICGLQFYKLRHSFGNHARNTCRKSKDDVALALNHVDHGRRTTDIYLAKDWTIIDEVQSAVLSLLKKNTKAEYTAQAKKIWEAINLPILK